MTNPFNYINSISYDKKNLMTDDIEEKKYSPFIVNRGLSYFPDTVLMANEMNIHNILDKRLQFDFLINIVRKRKRFSRWIKSNLESDVEAIKEYYGYSNQKARNALSLLTPEKIKIIKEKVYKGGRK